MRLVCVTGMHRSGTSLVTRVLNLLGVELGPESAMMAATPDNPRGYWEAEVLTELNDAIIESLGGRWHRLPAFPDDWEQAPELEPFRRRARAALDELFGDAPIGGFKDPRTSVLLPFWRTVREVDHSVLVVRDPDEVIGSVVKRDGFEPEKAASLWTDHTVAAYVDDPSRHVVVYEDLLEDPVAGAKAMAAALDLPEPTNEVLAEIREFADPSLRRQRDHRADDGPEVRAARDVHRLVTADAAGVDGILGLFWEERNAGRLRDVRLRQQGDELAIHQRDLRTALRERDNVREQLAQRSRELDQVRRDLTKRGNELEQARRQADRWRNEYDRLANRRVVKLALNAVEPLKPVVRKARELTGGDPTGGRASGAISAVASKVTPEKKAPPHVPATQEEADALQRKLEETAPGSERTNGPLVSILVLNRDGADHLRRMLPGLAATTYRDFELIVVDNASSDESVELIRGFDLGDVPVTVIENEENATFSHGNNQAFEVAKGEYALLLNNDIEPAVPGWLGHLVDTLEEREAAAVGARLIYPRRPGLDNAGDTVHPDLTLQHRGVHFDGGVDGVPRGRNLGAGEDPLAPAATAITEMPAVTAACMLVRSDVLRQVGGLTEGYRYGTEDVDLCMKIREAGGRILFDGGAVLWHHEYGTQNAAGRERKRLNRIHNREQFVDLWGPRIFREILRDRILGTGDWSFEPLHVAITVTKDDPTAGWGDYYTAHELGDALLDLGWRVSYVERYDDRWYDLDPDIDVLIVLIDAFDLTRVPRSITSVAWVRNWTDRWASKPWFADYDLVLASSRGSKEHIERVSSKQAHLFPLATNPERMRPQPADDEFRAEMLFVGNYWDEPRDIIDAIGELPPDVDLHVHGANWEKVPSVAPYDRGHLDYEMVPTAYSSAQLVLDDTAGHTKPWGAVNSRVFDALAAGALVISDNPEGVAELFGEGFPTWSNGAELAEHLERFRSDPEEYRALAAKLRERVLAEHTYPRRAQQLRDLLLAYADATRVTIAIGVPRRELLDQWGDTHYARDIQRQLELGGVPTRVALLPEWTEPHTGRDDVILHLFGLSEMEPRTSQLNVLWNISHPEKVTPGMVERYDVAFIASRSFASSLGEQVTVPVHPLPQATEPSRFKPTSGGPPHQLLFVANSRKVRRRIVDDLTRAPDHELEAELAIYGADWTSDLVDPRYVAGDHVPNTELPRYYSAAEIVLNDHWDDMREHGFLSNRLYDALACGSLVVSDHVDGIEEEFDGAVVTYETPAELHEKVRYYLAHPVERRELAERGRRIVLERHTFAHRVGEIRAIVDPLVASRPRGVVPVGVEA